MGLLSVVVVIAVIVVLPSLGNAQSLGGNYNVARGLKIATNYNGVDTYTCAIDCTSGLQAAIDDAVNDTLFIPGGSYVAAGLVGPNGPIKIVCGTPGIATGSRITLKPGANTWLLADYSYANNTPTGAQGLEIDGCFFDGNKTTQSGSIGVVILRTFRSSLRNVRVQSGFLHGLLFSVESANGTPSSTTISENRVSESAFTANNGAGIAGIDNGHNKLGDNNFGPNNSLSANGILTNLFCNVHLDRAVGGGLVGNNQLYASPNCDLNALNAGEFNVTDNHFDGGLKDTTTARAVYDVQISTGGYGIITYNGNTNRSLAASMGSLTNWTMLKVFQNVNNTTATMNSNTFYSPNLAVSATVSYAGAGAVSSPLYVGANGWTANTPAPVASSSVKVVAFQ